MICAALAMETSRSSLVPPNSTATFTASSLYSQGKWRLNTRRGLADYALAEASQASEKRFVPQCLRRVKHRHFTPTGRVRAINGQSPLTPDLPQKGHSRPRFLTS